MDGRLGWQMRGSVVRARRSGLESHQGHGIFFLQVMHHLLRIFIFVRWGLVRVGSIDSFSHKNVFLVIINDYFLEKGVGLLCPIASSFIRDYLPWLECRVGRSHDAYM